MSWLCPNWAHAAGCMLVRSGMHATSPSSWACQIGQRMHAWAPGRCRSWGLPSRRASSSVALAMSDWMSTSRSACILALASASHSATCPAAAPRVGLPGMSGQYHSGSCNSRGCRRRQTAAGQATSAQPSACQLECGTRRLHVAPGCGTTRMGKPEAGEVYPSVPLHQLLLEHLQPFQQVPSRHALHKQPHRLHSDALSGQVDSKLANCLRHV